MQKYFEITLRLWKILKPFHNYFYWQLFFHIILQIISIFSILTLAKTFDSAIIKNWSMVSYYLLIGFALLISNRILSFISAKQEVKNSYGKIQQHITEYSLKNILKLNPSQYTEHHSAIRLQIIEHGEIAIKNIIEIIVLHLLSSILLFISSLIAISWYSLEIAGVSLIIILLILFMNFKFINYWAPKLRESTNKWNKQRKIKVEIFEHLSLLKIFSVENNYLLKYLSNRLEIVNYDIYVWLLNKNYKHFRELILDISQFASIIMAIYFFAKGQFSIGMVYAIFTWISRMYDNLDRININLRQMPNYYIDIENYLKAVDMQPEFNENGKKKFKAGAIVFENVSFKYPKSEKNVLQNLSLQINLGEKVAFVGYSGSGKTTIVQLLLRAYDYQSGSIKIANQELKDLI